MEAKEFGQFIAEVRKSNHITQIELARKLNVTDKAVSRWERGLGFPDISTLEPLAAAFGVSYKLEYLEFDSSEYISRIGCMGCPHLEDDVIS